MSKAHGKFLDRSKPYGEVHPAYQGAHFEQGGYHFDQEGRIVDALLSDEQREALEKAPKAKGNKPSKPEGDDDKKQDGDDLNLEQWLRGNVAYEFTDVQKCVKTRFNKWCTTKIDILDFLVDDQKIVTIDELGPDLKAVIA